MRPAADDVASVVRPWWLLLVSSLALVGGCAGDARDRDRGDGLAYGDHHTGGDFDGSSCPGVLPLGCGARLSHSTASHGRPNAWFGYNCSARAQSGREALYAVQTGQPCQAMARLSELTVDLDLFLLSACDPFTCIAASPTPFDIQEQETIAFDAAVGQPLILAVDGYAEASGSYVLALDCLCGPPLATPWADGAWRLVVDWRWDGSSGGPLTPDQLEETDYQPVADGTSYVIEISEAWQGASIGVTPLIGALVSAADTAGALRYDLISGAFAGGRFLVWNGGAAGLQAELTLYGSGVPIVPGP